MKKNNSTFVSAGLGIMFIICCMLLLFIISSTQTRVFWEVQLDKLALITERCRADANNWVLKYVMLMNNTSNELSSGRFTDSKDYEHYLMRVKQRNEEVTSVYCWLEDGISYYDEALSLKSSTRFDKGRYRSAADADGEVIFSDAHVDEITGLIVVSCLRSVKTDDGKLAVIGFDVSIEKLNELAYDLCPSENSGVYFATSDMKILAHCADPAFAPKVVDGKISFFDTNHIYSQADVLQTIGKYSDKGISIEYINDYDSKLKYKAVTTIPASKWILGVSIPISDYDADLAKAVKDQLPVLVTALALSVISVAVALIMISHSRLQRKHLATALEAAEEAAIVKSSFLATISHEIRTPMNAIIGMSDILLNEEMTESQQKYVSDIKHSSNALLVLINEILDFSRIESGKLLLTPVHFLFRLMLSDIESIVTSLIKNKPIAYEAHVIGDIPEYLYGDDVRIRQVLINLISNAVKFTDRGYVKLNIYRENDTIKFSVSDTGKGIKKTDIPKLFAPFSRIDEQNNRNVGGTGLGLSICKSLAELMGGDITVESEFGRGTVFMFKMPLVEGNPDEVKQAESFKDFIYAPEASILVVDDNEINLRVVKGMLKFCGIEPHMVTSGEEALSEVQKKDFDIILMDHMMPGMDGIECTHRIRALGGKYATIPIVALTANAVSGMREMYIEEGMSDFISKPIDTIIFNLVLAKYLPEEKTRKKPKEWDYTATEAELAVLNKVNELGCIDVKLGLSRVMDHTDAYIKNLDVFARNMPQYLENTNKQIHEKNLKAFSISVHGIKGSLANIGAMNLSQLAGDLENAANDGDVQFCVINILPLIDQLQSISKELTIILSTLQETHEKELGNTTELFEKLANIKTMLDDFQVDDVIVLLDSLLTYTYGKDIDSELLLLKNQIDDYKYDLAIDTIAHLLITILTCSFSI